MRLSDDLAAHAADTRRRVIFLRPADAMTLPSPAAERLLIAAENRLLSTHYTVAPVFAGQPTKETFPVAQIPKPIPTAPILRRCRALTKTAREFFTLPRWQPAY